MEDQRAATALDACGALRYRASAERELGRLGHRPHRLSRPDQGQPFGIKSLTGRELEVARLVVDRKTNHEIAAELFLSQKTVETHLRNIFNKMGSPPASVWRVPLPHIWTGTGSSGQTTPGPMGTPSQKH